MGASKISRIAENADEYLFETYGDRLPVSFTKGDGSYLYDQDNKKYIDFFSGIAVNSLGYSNPNYKKALHGQIDRLIHSSNWFLNQEQIEAAKLISENSFPGKTLFVNSGTEANEAAIKLIRKYGLSISPKKLEIITFNNSFHGQTFGAMSAGSQENICEDFGPSLPGFRHLPFNDIKAFQKAIKRDGKIAGVMIELIQGEGGINVADRDFVKEIFETCNKKGIVTAVDEVQTGIGRTGKLFAYEHYGITPDIITMAKGLGGGVPVGALHAKNYLAKCFGAGSHGTTFGGNHLSMVAVSAVLKELRKKTFLSRIETSSEYIFEKLKEMKGRSNYIKRIKGLGLHIGFEVADSAMDFVKRALEQKLIINCTANNVIRIMPPLSIDMETLKEGMEILEKIILEKKGSNESTRS